MRYLLSVVEILLPLNWTHTRFGQRIDLVNPLGASRTDDASDDNTQRETVALWEWLAVHLPRKQDFFILADLAPRHRYGIVIYVILPIGQINFYQPSLNRVRGGRT